MERAAAVLGGLVGLVLLSLGAVAWVGATEEPPGVTLDLVLRRAATTDEASQPASAAETSSAASTGGRAGTSAPVGLQLGWDVGADLPGGHRPDLPDRPDLPGGPPGVGGSDVDAGSLADVLAELASDLRFRVGRADLDPAVGPLLDDLAAGLVRRPDLELLVRGHTDSTGTDEINAVLSAQRAQVVVAALVARGVPIDQLATEAVGATEPAADNATAVGRQVNRRSEVRILEGEGR